jgi:hypothetical protein
MSYPDYDSISIEEESEKPRFKKGDKYPLECGHKGRVVWTAPDRKTFAIKGTRRGCQVCGKMTKSGWIPLVFIILFTDE